MDKETQLREQMQAQRQMLEDALKELKQQNQELKDALAKVKRRNEELAEIAYRTSHDLRGPATTLQGLANLLVDNKDPELIEHFSKVVPELLSRIDIFSHSVSDFTNIINTPIRYQQIIWPDLINKKISDEIPVLLELKIQTDEEFFSDALRIETILKHLIRNAYQFNINQKDLRISVCIAVRDSMAEIRVSDNGTGIPPRVAEKIFEMFYRGSELSSGSGLGLYMVKTMVDDLHGKLSFQPVQDGPGASFLVQLPQLEPAVSMPDLDF